MTILEKNAISVAAPSKASVSSRLIVGIVGSNLAGDTRCLSFMDVVFCQVEVSAMGRSLVQGRPTECGASECDFETSTMRRSRPTRAVKTCKK